MSREESAKKRTSQRQQHEQESYNTIHLTQFATTTTTTTMRFTSCLLAAVLASQTAAFTSVRPAGWVATTTRTSSLFATAPVDTGFIATELRGAAMKLHTTRQAPKEGKVKAQEPQEKYVPTHDDYLHFLVDSQYVYQALEDIVNEKDELKQYRNTGLERTSCLETDIDFMMKEYNLARPEVGDFGKRYADEIRSITSIPEFMCHYYNFYFAHTAGGRMIGKQMASLLLEKKTLEFYKVCMMMCSDEFASVPW